MKRWGDNMYLYEGNGDPEFYEKARDIIENKDETDEIVKRHRIGRKNYGRIAKFMDKKNMDHTEPEARKLNWDLLQRFDEGFTEQKYDKRSLRIFAGFINEASGDIYDLFEDEEREFAVDFIFGQMVGYLPKPAISAEDELEYITNSEVVRFLRNNPTDLTKNSIRKMYEDFRDDALEVVVSLNEIERKYGDSPEHIRAKDALLKAYSDTSRTEIYISKDGDDILAEPDRFFEKAYHILHIMEKSSPGSVDEKLGKAVFDSLMDAKDFENIGEELPGIIKEYSDETKQDYVQKK